MPRYYKASDSDELPTDDAEGHSVKFHVADTEKLQSDVSDAEAEGHAKFRAQPDEAAADDSEGHGVKFHAADTEELPKDESDEEAEGHNMRWSDRRLKTHIVPVGR
jgi:hypothetical protein